MHITPVVYALEEEIKLNEALVNINNMLEELNQMDADYDYYDMENENAKLSFIEFCRNANVECNEVEYYSSYLDKIVLKMRVPFMGFENAITNIKLELEGNIPDVITCGFFESLTA